MPRPILAVATIAGCLLLPACSGDVVITPGGSSEAPSTTNNGGAGGSTYMSGLGGSGTGGAPGCTPGEEQPCACPSGATGLATCNDSGTGFGACAGCVPDLPWSKLFLTASEVAVAADDRVIVSVRFEDFGEPNGGSHLLGIDASGDVLWDRPHTTPGSPRMGADGSMRYVGLANDALTDIGGAKVSCSEPCVFAAGLDAIGQPTWVKTFDAADLGVEYVWAPSSAKGLGADGRIGLWLNVFETSMTTAWDKRSLVAQVSATGELSWKRRMLTKHGASPVRDGVVTPAGDLVVVGHTSVPIDFGDGVAKSPIASPTYERDGYVVRYGPTGDVVWSRFLRAAAASVVGEIALALDPAAGILFLLARIEGPYDLGAGPMGTAGSKRIVLAKLGVDGSYLSSQVLAEGVELGKEQLAVTAGPDGHRWICMTTFAGQTFAGAPLGGDAGDIAVLQYDASGGPLTARTFPASGAATCSQIEVGQKGVPVISGRIDGAIDFGQGLLDSGDGPASFVAKLEP